MNCPTIVTSFFVCFVCFVFLKVYVAVSYMHPFTGGSWKLKEEKEKKGSVGGLALGQD